MGVAICILEPTCQFLYVFLLLPRCQLGFWPWLHWFSRSIWGFGVGRTQSMSDSKLGTLLALFHCILQEPYDVVITMCILQMRTERLLECQKSGFSINSEIRFSCCSFVGGRWGGCLQDQHQGRRGRSWNGMQLQRMPQLTLCKELKLGCPFSKAQNWGKGPGLCLCSSLWGSPGHGVNLSEAAPFSGGQLLRRASSVSSWESTLPAAGVSACIPEGSLGALLHLLEGCSLSS